jgi:hypothetical protein
MGRVEPDRRQHRHHFAQEIIAHPGRLGRRELAAPQEAYALGLELGQHGIVEELILLRDELVRFGSDPLEREIGPGAIRSHRRRARFDFSVQTRDADLEELVEIAAHDAQEPQSLEQRITLVLRLRQDAAREGELTQLAVQIQMRCKTGAAAALAHFDERGRGFDCDGDGLPFHDDRCQR